MKIILATDGTSYSRAALEGLCEFNMSEGDEVIVISVLDLALPMGVDAFGGYLPDTSEIELSAKENAEKYVNDAKEVLARRFGAVGVAIRGKVVFGTPESRIIELAEEVKADLIVAGSHGYRRWERVLLGSVSNSLVQHAACSVMIVRRSPGQ